MADESTKLVAPAEAPAAEAPGANDTACKEYTNFLMGPWRGSLAEAKALFTMKPDDAEASAFQLLAVYFWVSGVALAFANEELSGSFAVNVFAYGISTAMVNLLMSIIASLVSSFIGCFILWYLFKKTSLCSPYCVALLGVLMILSAFASLARPFSRLADLYTGAIIILIFQIVFVLTQFALATVLFFLGYSFYLVFKGKTGGAPAADLEVAAPAPAKEEDAA